MSGAGIRWGLNLKQRTQIGLQACGEQNSAWFGLHRMLLGYAAGSLAGLPQAAGWAGIEPYAEVGGLDAELAGSLAHLLRALLDWWQCCELEATPAVWAERGRALLKALFTPAEELDGQVLEALERALSAWVLACEQAGFEQAVSLHALRQSWIEALNEPGLEQRFRAGGVTFCTLMPMRAVPFEVVCLLGMNDGDYPRRSPRSDFDLMGLAGQQRPGDRSRQRDDRQLMLEALLSARRQLYVSWTGRSIRDNGEQPPSVLVSQLRDYLAAIWGRSCVESRTTEHPLQPFSRRYFERQPEATHPLRTSCGRVAQPASGKAAACRRGRRGPPAARSRADAGTDAAAADILLPQSGQGLLQGQTRGELRRARRGGRRHRGFRRRGS